MEEYNIIIPKSEYENLCDYKKLNDDIVNGVNEIIKQNDTKGIIQVQYDCRANCLYIHHNKSKIQKLYLDLHEQQKYVKFYQAQSEAYQESFHQSLKRIHDKDESIESLRKIINDYNNLPWYKKIFKWWL